MRRTIILLFPLLILAACDSYEPRDKRAVYNPQTGELELPHPCPDWSKNAEVNYSNYRHSNFGCAVENNMALQLEDPRDLHRGHGDASPNAETTTRVIERYNAGEIPEPLVTEQSLQQ